MTHDLHKCVVLDLFPGIGFLGMAFRQVGFCVVQGGDVLWGTDVRKDHYLPGRFDVVIGGPPCQPFTRLVHINRANGYEPKHGNLIPAFERCVREALPVCFLMEEVPDAPKPVVEGYGVHSFILDNHQFAGETQGRKRRISFGWRGGRRILCPEISALEEQLREPAATGASSPTSIGNGRDRRRPRRGGGFRPGTAVLGTATRSEPVFRELCRKQGLPDDFDLPGMTVKAKCQAVGNGVPMQMGRKLAEAVLEQLLVRE
jgi:DNA (cytosine-5)-methyltransferase 1